mmetsp:Transcript_4363/g.10558  ORF Transcript_4363/g.10558 Transcript_4363/m.10558 type:complete len:207 (-) Transcript_4363:102-722(-)
MRGTPLEYFLQPVIFGYCFVALIDCYERHRTQSDDVGIQVYHFHKLQRLRLPLVQPRAEEHRLSFVHRKPDVALLHHQNDAIAMHDGVDVKLFCVSDCVERVADHVHALPSELVAASPILDERHVACRHLKRLEEAREGEAQRFKHAVGKCFRVWPDSIELFCGMDTILAAKRSRRPKNLIGRSIDHEVSFSILHRVLHHPSQIRV